MQRVVSGGAALLAMCALSVLALILAPALAQAQVQTQTQTQTQTRAQTQDSEADKGFLTNLLQDALSGAGRSVQIDGFRGSLSSTAALDVMTIADESGVWLTLSDVSLTWNRAALLRGRVEVEALTASSLVVARAPIPDDSLPEPEAGGFALPDLPVSVDIGTLSIDRVDLAPSLLGQPFVARIEGAASLVGGAAQARLSADRLDGARGTFALDARFDGAAQMVSIDLALSEAAGGLAAQQLNLPGSPSVDLTVTGAGPFSDLTVDLALATDGQERLAGQIVLGVPNDVEGAQDSGARAYRADISGDITALFAPEYRSFFGPDVGLRLAAVQSSDGALEVTAFDLRAQKAKLQGALRLAPGGWPSFFDVSGEISDASGAPVVLPAGPPGARVGRMELDISYDAAQDDAWTGRFDVRDFSRDDVQVQDIALSAAGQLIAPEQAGQSGQAATGRISADLQLQARGIAGLPDDVALAVGDQAEAQANVVYTQGAPVQLSEVLLTLPHAALRGEIEIGAVAQGLPALFDIMLEAQDFARFSGLAGQPLQGSGTLDITGRAAPLAGGFDVQMTGAVSAISVGIAQLDGLFTRATDLVLTARRDETGTFVDAVQLTNPDVNVIASAELRTGASRAAFDVTVPRAELVSPALPGAISITGSARQFGPQWRVDTRASGPYGVLAQISGPISLPEAPNDALRADLRVDAQMDGASGRLPAAIRQALGGQVRLGGRLLYTDGAPAELRDFSVTLPHADLRGTASLDLSQQSLPARYDFDLDARDFGRFSALAGRSLRGSGRLGLSGTAQAATGAADLSVQGAVRGVAVGIDQVDALLAGSTSVALEARRAGTGSGPGASTGAGAGGASSQMAIFVDRLALAGDALRASASGALIEGRSRAQFDVTVPRASVLAPGVPGALAARGTIQQSGATWRVQTTASGPYGATARVAGPVTGADFNLAIEAGLPDVSALSPDLSGPLSLSGRVARPGSDWLIDLGLSGVSGSSARIDGRVSATGQPDISIVGTAPLGLAQPFIAPRTIAGTAQFDVRLAGGFGLENLSGTAGFGNARLAVPSLRFALEQLSARAQISAGRVQLDAGAQGSGGGTVAASGTITLSGARAISLTAQLGGVIFADPQLYKTNVTGEVSVSGPLARPRIGGALVLNETNVIVPSSGLASIATIPPITHVGISPRARITQDRAGFGAEQQGQGAGEAARENAGLPIDIRISAPTRIFVRGRGLDAELGGQLRLTGTTSELISSGRFNLIRGRLSILDERFDLTTGSIRIEGDFLPYILFVASTETEAGTAQVTVEGLANAPEITFSASPDAPQDEVLAQLLFGRNLSQMSALQALQLANAVAVLAGNGGAGIIGNLRGAFNLDDIDLGTTDDGTAQVRIGAYISKNAYTDLAVDTDGNADVSINIDLTPNLTARGTAGADGGTSLGLFFEKDY